MKTVMLLGLCMIAACSYTPLEVLEEQAMLTGDWSAVERRERNIALRRAQSENRCPGNKVEVCESRIGQQRCSCVERTAVTSFLYGR